MHDMHFVVRYNACPIPTLQVSPIFMSCIQCSSLHRKPGGASPFIPLTQCNNHHGMDQISKCGGKKISSLDLWDPGGSPCLSHLFHACVCQSISPSWGLLPVFTSVVGLGSFLLSRTFGKIPFCFSQPGIQFWVWFFPVWILKISPSFGYSFH